MSDRIAWSSGHLAARFIITGLVVVAFALPARAQQTAQEEEEAAVPTPRIEEIVVTGTKREASIQVVPIAVSAFRGEDLRRRGIQDLEDLSQVSPSLQVYSSNSESNGGTIRIRGMGTTGNNPGLEAAVGTFIDGIYRSRSGQAFSDLLDVDRIEILRGPQGTLFGKNTSAGACTDHHQEARVRVWWNWELWSGELRIRDGQPEHHGPDHRRDVGVPRGRKLQSARGLLR